MYLSHPLYINITDLDRYHPSLC